MTDYTEGFKRWWSLYPSQRRKDKVKCFNQWKNRNLEARTSEIVRKLEADREWDEQWQKGYIPLAHTYLNGGRYDDDMPKPPRAHAPKTIAEREEPQREYSVAERIGNRALFKVLQTVRGVGDEKLKELVFVKNEIVKDAPNMNQEEYVDTLLNDLMEVARCG